jgi:hypothetical protein
MTFVEFYTHVLVPMLAGAMLCMMVIVIVHECKEKREQHRRWRSSWCVDHLCAFGTGGIA